VSPPPLDGVTRGGPPIPVPSNLQYLAILAIQVWHISHVPQMVNTVACLVRVHLDFCTYWGQRQSFVLFCYFEGT